MRVRRLDLFLGLVFCQLAGASRPFATDDAGTVAAGTFEAELGTESWKDASDIGISLKHGITPRMDLGVAIDYTAFPREERTYAPATLSLKYALVPDLLSASFASALGTPEYRVNGILTKSLGDFGVSANVGGEVEGGSRDAELTWGLSPTWNISGVTLGAEIAGERGNDVDGMNWKVGAQLHREPIDFDLAVGSSFQNDPQWRITAGVWFAFGTTERKN